MRLQNARIKGTILAGVIFLSVPLALASCAYLPWHQSEPWYTAYDIDSEDDLLTIASVPSLVKALENQDPEIRLEALKALTAIGVDARDAVPDLMKAGVSKEEDVNVRLAVADALEAVALTGENIEDNEENRKIRLVVQTIRLESSDWLVQREAVNQFVDLGKDAMPGLPALVRVIEDQSNRHAHYDEIRCGAVRAIGNIGPDARTATPALIRLMNSKDFQVRTEVVKAMEKIGPPEDKAIQETLIQVLNGNPELIVFRDGLAAVLPSNSKQMAYKGTIYGDPDFDVRLAAAEALGNFGPPAVAAVPALLDASLKDIDYDVRRQAVVALCKIQPDGDAAMQALDTALSDKKATAREAAVLALRKVRPENRESWLPKIIACLDDTDEAVRFGAVKTLSEYKIRSDKVFQALHRVALEDKSLKVKQEAVNALHAMNGK
ncbi:MAG: HEAT repeat domain-containing protein [Thermodesulfobacteriota bacterium]